MSGLPSHVPGDGRFATLQPGGSPTPSCTVRTFSTGARLSPSESTCGDLAEWFRVDCRGVGRFASRADSSRRTPSRCFHTTDVHTATGRPCWPNHAARSYIRRTESRQRKSCPSLPAVSDVVECSGYAWQEDPLPTLLDDLLERGHLVNLESSPRCATHCNKE